jgi:DNA-binding NarL/FixJ family response regulator
MNTPISIMLIDDHPLVGEGIKTMLQNETWLSINVVAKTGEEALTILNKYIPDIILLDISLPDTDGIRLCKKIRLLNSSVKIIGLSSTGDAGIINALINSGAHGYLLKNMEKYELIEAIQAVLKDKLYLSNEANTIFLQHYHQVKQSNETPILTRREKEILILLHEGLSGPAIAEKLVLSPLTVETHRKNILQKLNVHNTQQLLSVARKMNFIE